MPPDQGGRVVGRIIGAKSADVRVQPLTQLPEVEPPFSQESPPEDREEDEGREGLEERGEMRSALIHAAQHYDDTLIVVATWRTFLEAQYAEATVRHYLASVMQFFMTHPVTVQQVNQDHIVAFLQKYKAKPAIRRARYQGLKSFFEWAQRRGVRPDDPTDGLRVPHPEQKVPRGLTKAEIVSLVRAGHARTPYRGATIELLFYTACRVGELVTIRWEDIDEQRLVLHGWKSNKERIVDMTPPLRAALATLWEWSGTFDYVVPRSKATVWGWCRQAGTDAGIDRCHPHLFRSSAATAMDGEGASAFAIQTALGHAKVQTTMRYVQVRDEDRRAAFESLALPG